MDTFKLQYIVLRETLCENGQCNSMEENGNLHVYTGMARDVQVVLMEVDLPPDSYIYSSRA